MYLGTEAFREKKAQVLRQKPWGTVVGARWPLKGLWAIVRTLVVTLSRWGSHFLGRLPILLGSLCCGETRRAGAETRRRRGVGCGEMAAIPRARRWWLRPGRGSRGTPRPRYTRFLQDLDSKLPGGPSLDSPLPGEYIRGFARWRAHGHVGSAWGWAFSWLFLGFAAGPGGVHRAESAVRGVHVFLF